MTTTLQALAERVSQGEALSPGDAALIAASTDLIAVGMMADEIRRALHGAATTFGRVFEMHVDAVPDVPPPAMTAGEFRLVGTPASAEAACAAVARARRVAGSAYLTGFSLNDLEALHQGARTIFEELHSAGLDAIAETPLDPSPTAVIETARRAGLVVDRLVVLRPPRQSPALVAAARHLQATVGGFRAFAPLPRTISIATPTTGYDDVKLVALARMVVRDIPSIQVDWPLYGPKLAQVALTMGADDVDGVAAIEQGTLGTRRSAIEEIRGNIRAAGLQPSERDGRFQVLAR